MAMSDLQSGTTAIERNLNTNRTPKLVGGVVALLLGAIAIMLVGKRLPSAVVMAVLALLATIGVAASIGLLFGLVRIGARSTRQAVADWTLRSETDGVAVATREGEIVFANRAYTGRLDRHSSATLTPDLAIDADQDGSVALARLAEAASRGDRRTDEVRTVDGRWLRISVSPVDLSAAQRGLTAWRVREVSADRERMEATFVAAQDAVAQLDLAPVGFLAVRADGVVVHMNATAAQWTGTDLAQFRQRETRLGDLFEGDPATALLADEPGAANNVRDLLLRRANGSVASVQVIAGRPLQGGRRLLVLVDRRGEGRKEASPGLDASAINRLFEHNPIAMASVDAEGRVARANHSFVELMNAGAGADLASLLGDSAGTALRRALDAAADGRPTPEPIDCMVPTPTDGGQSHFRLLLSATGADDEIAVVSVTNNSERVEIERAYVQAQKMEAVGQLAGGMAHDFNNVLTGISVSTDLLLDSHPEPDPSNLELRTIRTNVTRAAALVRHLLAFSKKQTMQPTVLPLAEVLADADILLRNMAQHVKLVVEPRGDLWHVRADRNQLDQVLTNLVKNAGEATEKGGTITIGARNVPAAEAAQMPYRGLPAEDFAMIEVIDTGHGMDRATLERVFEPFFTTKEVGKGTGLGLAMVYGTIKQSGGFIYVDSELGRGTRFRLLLPRHRPTESELSSLERRAQTAKQRRDITGTGTILLVEDEHVVRAASLKALRRQGYTVHEAADGEEGLEVLEELDGDVDVVVSDVVMPEMNGPSMLREIRSRYGDRHRVVFVSGHAEDAFASDLPDDAEFLFLAKPYNLSQLAATVKDALSN